MVKIIHRCQREQRRFILSTSCGREIRRMRIDRDRSLCDYMPNIFFSRYFPSLAHQWLFAILAASGCPAGFQETVAAIYWINCTFAAAGGTLEFLFFVLSCVLQGCPLSGFLFALCMDPFLWLFQAAIDLKNCGVTRACADDVGMALTSFKFLKLVAPVSTRQK